MQNNYNIHLVRLNNRIMLIVDRKIIKYVNNCFSIIAKLDKPNKFYAVNAYLDKNVIKQILSIFKYFKNIINILIFLMEVIIHFPLSRNKHFEHFVIKIFHKLLKNVSIKISHINKL